MKAIDQLAPPPPSDDFYANSTARISGFGRLSETGKTYSRVLQSVEVQVQFDNCEWNNVNLAVDGLPVFRAMSSLT